MTLRDTARTVTRSALLRPSLLALAACFATAAAAPGAAHAQSVDPAQIQALQDQIKQLQAEIDGLVANQVKQSKKISSIAPAKGAIVVTSPGKGQIKIGAITATLGGYIEADGIYRSRAMQGDVNSKLSGVPFNSQVLAGGGSGRQSEFRESARATRLSIGLKSKPNSNTTLSAFVEGDFLGYAGNGASTNSTNGFSPRLRQGWAGYERSDLGLHVFAGQSFSFVTQESVGMTPGKEAAFPIVDAAQTAGFVNIRQAGLRVFKDFGNKYFAGVSFENPTLMSVGTPGTALPSIASSNSSVSGVTLSDDVGPDVIEKLAADTSFGHYELFGIERFLRSREGITGVTPAGHSTIKTANGVGVSAFDSIIPKRLDIQGNFIWGNGIARYSASQLGDATYYTSSGGIKLLPSLVAQLGATVHVLPTLDTYAVAGLEQIHGGGTGTGYGNGVLTAASINSCYVPGGACGAEIKRVEELSVGAWWSFYKGPAGTFQTGFQYSDLRDVSFAGHTGAGAAYTGSIAGPSASASDNLVFVSLRYLPFK